jgi:ATP-dependent Clp protease adaptor protein ClpS
MTENKSSIVEKIAIRNDLQPPNMFKVIFVNDDITTVEFVVAVLIEIFNYNDQSATTIADTISLEGSAVVAVLPYELAEQKALEVTLMARNNSFPLSVKVEDASV